MALLKFAGNGTSTGTVTVTPPDTNNSYRVVMPSGSGVLVTQADLTTANVAETTNLYFTTARARQAISVTGYASYDSANGVITVSGPVTSVNGQTGVVTVATNITSAALYEHSRTIAANYTITANNNAVSAGPISVADGAVVTVPAGSTWVVV